MEMKLSNFAVLLMVIAFFSCKKKDPPHYIVEPKCNLVYSLCPDTNYIPHKNANYFNYCSEITSWSANIKNLNVVGKTTYFDLVYANSKSGLGPTEKFSIDSAGIYHVNGHYINGNYYDSLVIINPKAINGDTIYKNKQKQISVVLVDKNYTFIHNNTPASGCYYIMMRFTNGDVEHCYYKKQVGLLYWGWSGVLSGTQFQ